MFELHGAPSFDTPAGRIVGWRDGRTWLDAELVHGIAWADIHNSGQAVRELWARFAKTGSLPDIGRIEPNVLGYSRTLRRGSTVGATKCGSVEGTASEA